MPGGSRGWGAQTTYGIPVRLHIYDLSPANGVLHPIGFGLYHSGVEVDGEEYTFSQSGGVISHPPKGAETEQGHLVFRETLEIGVFDGTTRVVKDTIGALRTDFRGENYHLIKQNCNHFSHRLCAELFPSLPNPIPPYINRVAWVGSFFPCFLPSEEQQNTAGIAASKKQDARAATAFPGEGQRLLHVSTQSQGSSNVDVGGKATAGSEEEVRNRMTEVRRARLKYLAKLQQEQGETS